MIVYAEMITAGSSRKPITAPMKPPITHALMEYATYFIMIAPVLYPSALSVPISMRCSSTMRVMVVRLTSAATMKKITGNTSPTAAMRSVFSA